MASLICYQHFVPIGTDKSLVRDDMFIENCPQKAFLTAKFANKSQGSQRANYLFIKTLPTLCPRCVPCCYLKSSTFDAASRCNF